jgi:uroporphyrinogen III methyltransferase/synthase
MGASELREICERLIAAGMDKSMPAAVVESGTTARQRQATGTLEDLPERAEALSIKSPAVIVVGRVAALAETLDWRSTLPLAGRRILTARPDKKGGRLGDLLRERGAEVVEVSFSRTERIDAFSPMPSLDGYEWLVFTSAVGVEFFFEQLRLDNRDIREIGNAKIAAVGSATKGAIEARGLKVDLVPPIYSGAALGEALLSRLSKAAGRLLLLRAEQGAPELAQALRDGGLDFEEIPLYRTVANRTVLNAVEAFDVEDIDAVAFTSASSVRAFKSACPNAQVKAVCIGPQTSKAANEAGYETHVAQNATLEDLANAVEEIFL